MAVETVATLVPGGGIFHQTKRAALRLGRLIFAQSFGDKLKATSERERWENPTTTARVQTRICRVDGVEVPVHILVVRERK